MIDQWTQPIRFRETIEAMHADGVRVFLEVGPRGNLTGFVDDILAGREYAAIPCDLPSRSGLVQLLHALAQLAAHGVPANLQPLYARRAPVRLPLEGDAVAAPSRRRPLKLRMDIPIVALDEADRQNLRSALATALGGAASEPASVAAPDPHAPRPAGAPPADDPLLQTHLRTMGQLAAVHEEVMQAAFGSGHAE
jgi:acyl transferase domain-containing protein